MKIGTNCQSTKFFFSDIDFDSGDSPTEDRSRADVLWEAADDDAKALATAIEGAVNFAYEQATDDWRDFGQGFRESIEDGKDAWDKLVTEVGFDPRGVFRRYRLVPFVLVPRHVSQHHGEAEELSLLTLLQQAHDAFVLGVPFASLALMRSILEMTLKIHYRATGEGLEKLIDACRGLPSDVRREALHRLRRLANDILHFNKGKVRLPADFEREILSLLIVLRTLIEGAPSSSRV